MNTDEDQLQSDEKRKALPGSLENLRSCYSPARNKPIPRVLLKFAFFFLSLLFAAAFVGVLTKHDFLPYFTEHARELSKHRAREEEVEFHFVDNIENFPHKDERLPVDLEPLSYKLDLRVNLTTLSYSGVVKIKFLCNNATRFVILHSGDLDILNVSMTGRGKAREKGLRVQRIIAFKKNQQLCIELRKVLRKGEVYFVTLEFKSKISNRLEGFYKSSYSTKSGEKRTLGVTYFEPAHAREVFPCFDEPSFKASFTISITHSPEPYYALSNMPLARRVTRQDGLVEEHFAPSVNMSSYLVAFAVLDFRSKESKTDSGVMVRVHAPPSDYDRLEFALEAAVKLLSYFEKLFGEPFSLPKLDLLAVPDFLIGAMENWGLIMFRRIHLVYDQRFSSTDTKLSITKAIAHELAHQWFGNLVTMRWWNDLWLNEGFAKFIEDEFGVNHAINGWDTREEVVATTWLFALQADSAWASHPISVQVHRPEDIDDLFDSISYQKGAMIIRMLKNFLGEERFMKGIKRYIQKHKYGNAKAEELWDAIGEVNGNTDVKGMMKVWTDQKGFPIVSIRKQGDAFVVEQGDFLDKISLKQDKQDSSATSHGGAAEQFCDPSSYDSFTRTHVLLQKKWCIPLSFITQSHQEPRWVSTPQNSKLYTLKDVSTDSWIMANINATGFFMVNYDEENWKQLAAQLREDHKVFSPSDRAGLIHDIFTLSCQGLLDPTLALNLSRYLVRELHPVPWAVARKVTKCLMGVFSKPYKLLYKKFLWHLQDHLIDFLGTEDTGTDQERSFRHDVLSEAMKSGQRKDINSFFTQMFNKLKKTSIESQPSVGSNFRYLAFSFGVNKSSEEDWDYLWSVYQESPFDADRKYLMNVITSFDTDNIRLRNLLLSLGESKVRPQDSLYWIEQINKGRGKTDPRWDFIMKHWKTLVRRYGGSYKLGNLVKAVAGSFQTSEQLDMVKKTFESLHPGELAIRAQKQTLEKIRRNIAGKPTLLKTNEARMVDWLKKYGRQ